MSVESNFLAIVERGGKTLGSFKRKIMDVNQSTESRERKYVMLVEIVEAAASVIAPNTPCHRGCSNCCYQAVAITEREARQIEAHTHRAMVEQPATTDGRREVELLEANVEKYVRVPCTFLSKAGDCTIYPVRPLACRAHHSLDDTADRCDLFNNPGNTTPMLDLQDAVYAAAGLDIDGSFGDIRDYFPKEPTPA